MDKEFDINRGDYEKKVEEIRKKKRKLRDIQEPDLVKKIKKELKREQRGAKRHDKDELKKYLKKQIDIHEEENGLIFKLREITFGHSNEEAIPVIDNYLDKHPELLDIHDREWYYTYC